jgi:FixJ family two-component response regulator
MARIDVTNSSDSRLLEVFLDRFIGRLLSSAGFAVNTFASAEEYLNSDQPGRTYCLLLDARMPGKSGLELERQLVANHSEIPVILITAQEEETARTLALESHARTVLIKPFSEEILADAINSIEIFGLGHTIPRYY